MTTRRGLLAAAALLARPAAAALPSGPVRLIVGFAAGGGIDGFARLAARAASETSGTTFLVDNRPGASGLLAALAVARAAPDGRTVFMADSGTLTISDAVFLRPPLDPTRELTPVMLACFSPLLVVARPATATRLDGLLDAARRRPGALTYASAGAGNVTHLAIADFTRRAGVELTHVPYRGGSQMAVSVIAGETDTCLLSLPTALPFLAAGTLAALAVAGDAPLSSLPGVPTIASVVSGALARSFWYGFCLPAGVAAATLAALHGVLASALASPGAVAAMAPLGIQPVASTPEEFAAFIADETARRATMARQAGVVPE